MLKAREVQRIISERTKENVPLRTVYDWMQKNTIKTRRLGGKLFVRPEDLDIFLSDFQPTN